MNKPTIALTLERAAIIRQLFHQMIAGESRKKLQAAANDNGGV
jgi:hypothetical protein